MKTYKNILLVFLFSLLITFLFYWRLFFTFYQQDEWQAFGHFLASGWHVLKEHATLTELLFAKGRIFSVFLYNFLFYLFPFSTVPITIVTLLVHAINGLLVYLLVKKITKHTVASLFAMLFFLANTVANQAIIWAGASLAVTLSTFFILLSLLLFQHFVEYGKIRHYIYSLLLLYISFHFKESGLAILLFYVSYYLLFHRKKLHRMFFIYSILPIAYFILFLTLRVGNDISSTQKVGDYINSTQKIGDIIVVNMITYTSTIFSQLFFPPEIIFGFATWFVHSGYVSLAANNQLLLVSQTIGTDFINLFISFLLIILFIVCTKGKHVFRDVVFFIGILFAALLPYVIILRGSSYLESRYYYLLLIPASGLIGLMIKSLATGSHKMLYYSFLTCIVMFCIAYYGITKSLLVEQTQLSKSRLEILSSVRKNIPQLRDKTIFFVQSNKSYYSPTNPLPFQQGIGYTFLAYLYTPKDNLHDLLLTNFLWDIGTQGYMQIGNKGYGLFVTREELDINIKNGLFKATDVISFYYDSEKNELVNTTEFFLREYTK